MFFLARELVLFALFVVFLRWCLVFILFIAFCFVLRARLFSCFLFSLYGAAFACAQGAVLFGWNFVLPPSSVLFCSAMLRSQFEVWMLLLSANFDVVEVVMSIDQFQTCPSARYQPLAGRKTIRRRERGIYAFVEKSGKMSTARGQGLRKSTDATPYFTKIRFSYGLTL